MEKSSGALVSKVLPIVQLRRLKFNKVMLYLKFDNQEINKSTDLPLIVGQSKVGKSFSTNYP